MRAPDARETNFAWHAASDFQISPSNLQREIPLYKPTNTPITSGRRGCLAISL